MTASQNIRFGIIGAGNIGKVHMERLLELPGECELLAVTDAYLPLAEQRARDYGIPHVYASVEQLLASAEIDAVVIGVPNKSHASVAVAALEAGKHVLLEKPMGFHTADAKQIVRAQQRSGKTLMVSHQMRWDWPALQVKQQVERGELGRIYTAKTGWYRRKGIPGWGAWYTRQDEAGGGPLIDIGVHMLDLAFHLMGDPKPVSVFGSTYAEFGPHKRGLGEWGTPNWNGYYDVEDLACGMIKMEDGSSLSLEVSWAAHADIEQNGSFVHLMGSKGGAMVRGQGPGQKVKFLSEQFNKTFDMELTAPANDEGSRLRKMRHFIECVRTGRTPWTDAMSGLRSNLIIDAIYESSRTGHEVVLDWSL
ncbi:MAG: oxidoreductase [Paenibacillus sp.]|jgi:predicted dehydrogenase|nr:oxidoreductase [Paenibacillus sp.]